METLLLKDLPDEEQFVSMLFAQLSGKTGLRGIEYLNTKEIKLHSGPFQPDPSIRFIYIQDPDGLLIQLVENIAQKLNTKRAE